MTSTLRLTEQLIARHSPTPQDGGCMGIITERLTPLGFIATVLEFGSGETGNNAEVKNLWIKRSRPIYQAHAEKRGGI